MSKKSQEHPYIPALNGEVLRTKHDKSHKPSLRLPIFTTQYSSTVRWVVTAQY
jgi:hypothetical protein